MQKHIRCAECRFARVDKMYCENLGLALLNEEDFDYDLDQTPDDGTWLPYECVNRKSEYYGSWLNVCINGYEQDEITWEGCIHGERKVR